MAERLQSQVVVKAEGVVTSRSDDAINRVWNWRSVVRRVRGFILSLSPSVGHAYGGD